MLLAESVRERVIGLAIEVHRHTGPGLLEAVYKQCLCVELRCAGVSARVTGRRGFTSAAVVRASYIV